jgi:hypothetical protein
MLAGSCSRDLQAPSRGYPLDLPPIIRDSGPRFPRTSLGPRVSVRSARPPPRRQPGLNRRARFRCSSAEVPNSPPPWPPAAAYQRGRRPGAGPKPPPGGRPRRRAAGNLPAAAFNHAAVAQAPRRNLKVRHRAQHHLAQAPAPGGADSDGAAGGQSRFCTHDHSPYQVDTRHSSA